ncbi:hypothetical protein [Weissella paramesenteroides]|uniref:hypothetical protein n=1 Tax=Weissella paramesenteroides TaxID=1249 RepID=UPI003D36C938
MIYIMFMLIYNVCLILLFLAKWIAMWDWGNVADWVSGIGSLGAIFMVLLQIRKDKESSFSQARPFFKINYKKTKIFQINHPFYYEKEDDLFEKIKKSRDNYQILQIKNISTLSMMAVQINAQVTGRKEELRTFKFKIDSIKSNDSVGFILKELTMFSDGQVVPMKEYYKLDEVDVFFTTELREKIKLVFKYDADEKSLKYVEHYLENKGQKISETEYSINNFNESNLLQ